MLLSEARDGGGAGAVGRLRLRSGADFSEKGLHVVPAADRVIIEMPGGGGYGDPATRDPALVARDEGVAVVGDLVVAQSPFFDTGCEEGWRRALEAIDAASWTTLIPGHGAPMNRADFARWRTAFGNWLDCAASDRAVGECTDGWMADARGFYSEAEAASVRALQDYYVAEVLRAPAERRMDYCRTG